MTRRGIRHGPCGIENQPEACTPYAIPRVTFHPFHEELVEQVLGDDETERSCRRDGIIHPPRRLRSKTNVAKRGFADGPHLELQTVHSGERCRASAARPVSVVELDGDRGTWIVLQPQVSSRRPVNRMTDVVDEPRVRVLPGTRHVNGPSVVIPEVAAQFPSRLRLQRQANAVLDSEQCEGVEENTRFVNALRARPGRREREEQDHDRQTTTAGTSHSFRHSFVRRLSAYKRTFDYSERRRGSRVIQKV